MRRFILTALLLSSVATTNAQQYDYAAYKKMLDEGIDSFFAGNNDFAHQKFITAFKIDSQSFYSLFYLSWSKLERRELPEALRLVNKAIYVTDPGRNEEYSYYVRGLVNYELGRYAESVSDFKKVNAIKPYDVIYMLLLSRGMVANHEFEKALPIINEALELDSTQSDGYYFRAVSYSYLGQTQAAIADFLKNLSFETKETLSYYNLGNLYMQLKNFRKAAAYYEDYIKQGEDSTTIDTAMLEAGICHYFAGNHQKSMERLNSVIKKTPASPRAYTFLALGFAEMNQIDKARQNFNKALTFKPEQSLTLHYLGKLEYHSGDKKKAQTLFNKAVAAAEREKSPEMLYDLAKTYFALADTATALQMVEKTLSLAPKFVLPRLLQVSLQTGIPEKEKSVLHDLNTLINRKGISDKEKAYFVAYKAIAAAGLGKYDDAIKYLDTAIILDAFPEYYAMRAYVKTFRYGMAAKSGTANKKMQGEIEQDIDKALETNHRKTETRELKAMILIAFDRHKEACDIIASIPNSKLKQICANGEKWTGNWEVSYKLTSYEDLVADFKSN